MKQMDFRAELAMATVTAIVPIKLNNERLPGKNTKLLGKKPLISYCLKTLLTIKEIQNIYVYCNSEEIIKFLPDGITFLKRPKELDSSVTNFTQIFEMFKQEINSDIYIYMHATSPFLTPETIRRGLDAVLKGEYDSAFCAQTIQDYLWQDGKPLNFDPANLPRTQDLPIIFKETNGVYVFRREVFEEQHRRIGKKPYMLIVGCKESIDIDSEEDFHFAEIMLNSTM
jgi:CMP-N-acetylneuraminic acid synthetase